jgi:hypothetical protein
MEIANLITHIEALVFASEKPLTSLELVELINNAFGFLDDKIVIDQVETAIDGIREKYNAEFYPFELRESGGGWQFLTKRKFHQTIAQLNGDKFLKRLSNAALEKLAIIAYKQPITKFLSYWSTTHVATAATCPMWLHRRYWPPRASCSPMVCANARHTHSPRSICQRDHA